MLDEHGNQLARELTQETPWVLAPPLINLARRFPKLKKPFNLPTSTDEHESFGNSESLDGNIGDQNDPLS